MKSDRILEIRARARDRAGAEKRALLQRAEKRKAKVHKGKKTALYIRERCKMAPQAQKSAESASAACNTKLKNIGVISAVLFPSGHRVIRTLIKS